MSFEIKCRGGDCIIKQDCYRYTVEGRSGWTPCFEKPPYQFIDGQFECKFYYGDNADYIMDELNSIMGELDDIKDELKDIKKNINNC